VTAQALVQALVQAPVQVLLLVPVQVLPLRPARARRAASRLVRNWSAG